MGPAPQVFQAEVQVPCQTLYQQVGATQSCCPHNKEPLINYLQVQRETPASSEAGSDPAAPSKVTTPGNILPPKLPPTAEQCGMLPRLMAWGGWAPPLTNLCLPFPALKGLMVANSGEGHLGGLQENVTTPKPGRRSSWQWGLTGWLTMVYSGTMVEGMRAWRKLSTCFRKMNHVEFTCSRICNRTTVPPLQGVLPELPCALLPLPLPVLEVIQGSAPPQPQ